MLNICINRKGKQRKSSVRRGARKELDQKEQKRLLLLGTEPCTPTANTVYIRFIRRIYTALCKPIYTDTDTDTVASTNIRPYIYGVYIRIRFWPTLKIDEKDTEEEGSLSMYIFKVLWGIQQYTVA